MKRELVELDKDHPGFRDSDYRRRRNEIARLAIEHVSGRPAPRIAYTDEERGVWRNALEHLIPLHEMLGCKEMLEHWPQLHFTPDEVPQLVDLNLRLQPLSGFSLQPVAGLVEAKTFMAELGRGCFLSTQYMRHHTAPLYTPEPDVIHELVGHAALLAYPKMAHVNRLFGQAAVVGNETQIAQLIRTYWWTLEFGAVRENGRIKAVGAGLLSSYGELGRMAEHPNVQPFDLKQTGTLDFDPTNYQGTLFVAESMDALLDELAQWLESIVRENTRA